MIIHSLYSNRDTAKIYRTPLGDFCSQTPESTPQISSSFNTKGSGLNTECDIFL